MYSRDVYKKTLFCPELPKLFCKKGLKRVSPGGEDAVGCKKPDICVFNRAFHKGTLLMAEMERKNLAYHKFYSKLELAAKDIQGAENKNFQEEVLSEYQNMLNLKEQLGLQLKNPQNMKLRFVYESEKNFRQHSLKTNALLKTYESFRGAI